MLKKSRKSLSLLLGSCALLALAVAGCGGGSSSNVVTIAVSPATSTVIVSQSLTLTASVSGTTDTTISSWTCQYQTIAVDSTGKSTNGTLQACTSSTGTIPANSTGTTVTYTAPNQVPDPTKISGNNCASGSNAGNGTSCLLSIVITATAHANTKKTATGTITLDSGISVTLSATTATVPTGEQQPFSVTLTNDLQTLGVTWLVTQGTATTTLPYPSLTTCSPTCGTITSTGLNSATYTAPSSVPTTATLTYVATSKADTTRFAIGTITIVKGGPITFNGLSPTIAPQGAPFYDIYLDAPFVSSASVISLAAPGQSPQAVPIEQLKVLFPIPTTTVANPTSTGARVRLLAKDLASAQTFTVSITDPAEPVSQGAGPFSFSVVPVRPTSVASIPDSIPQNGTANELSLAIDGGYFGPSGSTLANALFNGTAVAQSSTVASSSRQLNLAFDSSKVNSVLPGLYPLSVSRTTAPIPTPLNNSSVTDIAVLPDYSVNPPTLASTVAAAGANPSAVDIDTQLGVLVVAETGSNLVQFFAIGNNSLTALACPTSSCAVNAPTGLSINKSNHTVAVVSAQDQKVVVLPFPCPPALQSGSSCAVTIGDPNPNISYPLTVSLVGLIPSAVSPQPIPYSIGLDSDTNDGIVAYSSNATPTTAKVGYLIDFNFNSSQTCLQVNGSFAGAPCAHAQVTLNTGQYPQVAMVPHTHTALVTPGGAGVVNAIDVTKASSSLQITSVSLISGLVTVTVNVPSGQTLGLNPGNPGTVLIQGVPNGANGTNFNGVFSVLSVLNANSFTYGLTSSVNDSSTCSSSTCEVFFSTPNLIISASQTLQGIAINPISRTAALADANATGSNGPQIDLLNSLDQSFTSITFHANCTSVALALPCTGAPELLGTTDVAFQPYSNVLVSYNPQQNQVSISDPTNLQRNAFVCNVASGCVTNPTDATTLATFLAQTKLPGPGASSVTVNGTTLNLFGGLAVDPVTNQAFVVQSGAGNILIVDLTNLGATTTSGIKPVEITELQVPTVAGTTTSGTPCTTIGGIPCALMAQGTLTSNSDLAGVQLFGAGFDSNAQVFLDGTLAAGLGSSNAVTADPNGRRLTFTIPKSFLSLPHKYAVTVADGSPSVTSNATDFFVIKAVDFSRNAAQPICSSSGAGLDAQPNAVAIADQLPGQGFSPIAVVSNTGCNNIAILDINPANTTFGSLIGPKLIATGNGPAGVAVSPRFGLAVVANSSDGTASVLNLLTGAQSVPAVTVGSTPAGVAINEGTGAALIANSGTNTVSELNLSLLFVNANNTTAATSLTATTIAVDQSPIAVAIDPDRGTNFRGLAVVTALQLVSGGSAVGVLDAVDIGGASPAKSTTGSNGSVTATPTGLVFDPCPKPAVETIPEKCTETPALFYATSSGGNVVTAFNPDSAATSSVHVGINPTSLAINPQTGGIVTVNSSGHTISIIDTLSNPFKTRSSFGLSGSAQFGVAIDQFTNLAVIADQANSRLLIFPIPN